MIELNAIAQAIGEPFNAENVMQQKRLASIRDLVAGNEAGIEAIAAAEAAYSDRVHNAFAQLASNAVNPPSINSRLVEAERPVRVKSDSGVRYSFGTKWNVSVHSGKGIAFAAANRDKLNNQYATYKLLEDEDLDIESALAEAAAMSAAEVAAFIAAQFSPADIGN